MQLRNSVGSRRASTWSPQCGRCVSRRTSRGIRPAYVVGILPEDSPIITCGMVPQDIPCDGRH